MPEGQFDDPMPTQHQKNASTATASNNSHQMGVSARKLAATLWELQEISLSSAALPTKISNDRTHLLPPDISSGERHVQPLPFPPSPASGHVSMRSLRRSTVKCRFGDAAKRKQTTTIPNAATTATHMQVLKLLEHARPIDNPEEEEDTHEIEVDKGATTRNRPCHVRDKSVPSSINNTSTTSSELLKVLNRVWSLEEQHKSSLSVMDSLQADLEGARSQVKELTIQQLSHSREMENLSKKLSDERIEWQEKEQERTMKELQALKEELEDERKSKRKLDLIHRKVTKELIDVKKSLMKALKDLEREQKARELMEDVCDELAREVGEDKARVEELKRESIKVREEVEEERKMLQVAEVWREERVQMKLAEARLEIEEKNTALDKLRMELDAFLKAKRALSASQDLADFMNANLKPELPKTNAAVKERQSSANLVNLLKEAYDVDDEYETSGKHCAEAHIKGTIRENEPMNDNPDVSGITEQDEEDGDDDEEEEDDQSFIELNKSLYVTGDEMEQSEKKSNVSYGDKLGTRNSIDKQHFPIVESVMNQAARQGLRNANASRADATGMMGETKDKVKMWNLELETPVRADTMVEEKADRQDCNAETKEPSLYEPKCSLMKGEKHFPLAQVENKGSDVYDPKSNMKGERYLAVAQDDPAGKSTSQNGERGAQASLGSISSIDVNIKPCESSSNMEAISKGVWSIKNLGSGRHPKAACAFSSAMQQPESINQNCVYDVSSSSGLERLQDGTLSSRPTNKASAPAAPNDSKDKNVKGKLAETKTEARQPRFRIGRG
ncbi:hypothetical protein L7F22_005096 [Adiantum nelumboides]|nr:hypothetical protein [Adiantum nelumboides]